MTKNKYDVAKHDSLANSGQQGGMTKNKCDVAKHKFCGQQGDMTKNHGRDPGPVKNLAPRQTPRRVKMEMVWRVALDLAHGLAYLDRQGTVHRDVKADNVLLDQCGRAKLADLGLAKVDSLVEKKQASVIKIQKGNKKEKTDLQSYGITIQKMLQATDSPIPKPIRLLMKRLKTAAKGQLSAVEVICELEKSAVECGASIIDCIIPRIEAEVEIHRRPLTEYIPSLIENGEESPQQEEQLQPTIIDKLDEFLEDKSRRVLSIHGGSGSGKTLSCYWFANALLDEYRRSATATKRRRMNCKKQQLKARWRWLTKRSKFKRPTSWVPIFLRPAFKHWTHDALVDGIEKALTSPFFNLSQAQLVKLQRSHHRVVFILDGYDELSGPSSIKNLPQALGVDEWPRAKLIIASRGGESSMWEFNQSKVSVYNLMPFTLRQRLQYLQNNVNWSDKVDPHFFEQLLAKQNREMPGFINNNFLLHLFVRNWDVQRVNELNSVQNHEIYHNFVYRWVTLYGRKLSPSIQREIFQVELPNSFDARDHEFKDETKSRLKEATKRAQGWLNDCAIAMARDQTFSLPSTDKAISSVWTQLRQRAEELASEEFKESKRSSSRSILSENQYRELVVARVQNFLNNAPLIRRNDQYQFVHTTMWEYCFARGIHTTLSVPIDQCSTAHGDNSKLLSGGFMELAPHFMLRDLEVLSFLDSITSDDDIKHWNEWLDASREREEVAPMAACAVTALNGLNCIPSNLQGVKIPNADLRYAVLAGNDCSSADMSGVQLTGACLDRVKFCKTTLTNATLGQFPSLAFDPDRYSYFAIAVHPTENLIAVASREEILIVNPSTMDTTLRWGISLEDIQCVAYHPTSNTLVLGGGGKLEQEPGGILQVWDVQTGFSVATLVGHTKRVNAVAYNEKGSVLASGGEDGTIRLWDGVSFVAMEILSEGEQYPVRSLSWTSSASMLVAGYSIPDSKNNFVRVWDVDARTIRQTIDKTGQLVAASFNWTFFITTERPHLIVRSTRSGKEIFRLSCMSDVTALVCMGELCAAGDADGIVRIYDVSKSSPLAIVGSPTSERMTSLAFSKDGKILFASDKDVIRAWGVHRSPRALETTLELREFRVQFDMVGETMLTSLTVNFEDQTKIWSGTGMRWTPRGDPFESRGVMSPNGKLLVQPQLRALSARSSEIRVISTESRAVVHKLPLPDELLATCMTFSFSSQAVAISFYNFGYPIYLWHLPSDSSSNKVYKLRGHQGFVNIDRLSFSHDEWGLLASADSESELRLWNAREGRPHTVFPVLVPSGSSLIKALLFSPREPTLAVSHVNQHVVLFDVSTGTGRLLNNTKSASGLAFTPDGQILATGGGGNQRTKCTVRLWDARSTLPICDFTPSSHNNFTPTFTGLLNPVNSKILSVSIGGTKLVVSVLGEGFHVYDISSLPPTRVWSSHPSPTLSARKCDMRECAGLTDTQRAVLIEVGGITEEQADDQEEQEHEDTQQEHEGTQQEHEDPENKEAEKYMLSALNAIKWARAIHLAIEEEERKEAELRQLLDSLQAAIDGILTFEGLEAEEEKEEDSEEENMN